MNKRHYEHTLPNIRGSLSNTYEQNDIKKFQLLLIIRPHHHFIFPFLSKGIMELPFTRNFTLLPLLISDSTHAKKHSFAIRFIPISI